MRKQKNADTIKITEDVRIPGTDVILEAGDQIKVVNERLSNVKSLVGRKIMGFSYVGQDNEGETYELTLDDNSILTVSGL